MELGICIGWVGEHIYGMLFLVVDEDALPSFVTESRHRLEKGLVHTMGKANTKVNGE